MKQHLAKSLLMAGAMIASYPLLAQQYQPAQPVQQAQPMPSAQTMPSTADMPGTAATPAQMQPDAASTMQAQAPAAPNPYAQGSTQGVRRGVPPSSTSPAMAPGAPGDPTVAANPAVAVDAASMSLPPDALGSRLGRRNPFLDGA